MVGTQLLSCPGMLGVRSPADILRRPSLKGFPAIRRPLPPANTRVSPAPPDRQLQAGLVDSEGIDAGDDDF
jgi:hypothetical protein